MLLSDMVLASESFWGKISKVLDTSPEIRVHCRAQLCWVISLFPAQGTLLQLGLGAERRGSLSPHFQSCV